MADLLVNIDVDDLERGIAFYREAFGLTTARRFGDYGVELLGLTSPLYLLAKPSGSRAAETTGQERDYRRHWTPVHIDFEVEDLPGAVARARAAGATLEQDIQTAAWGRIAMFTDPFGNGFCLLEFLGRGYDEIALRA